MSVASKRVKKVQTILALTVGGAPQPIAFSVKANRPDRVIFFVSPDSEATIHATGKAPQARGERDTRGILQILKESGVVLKSHVYTTVVVPDQQLSPAVELMHRALLEALDRLMEKGNLLLDFTGGTKLMSAALALAGERLPETRYCYVAARDGNKSRDKGGLGVTMDGEEKVLHQDNPRNSSVFGLIEDAMMLMRVGSFRAANQLLDVGRQRVTDPVRKKELQAWIHFSEVYDHWESFRYDKALKSAESFQKMSDLAEQALPPSQRAFFLAAFEENKMRLEKLVSSDGADREFCHDLIANAERRGKESNYDEAILRLYRAVEAFGEMLMNENGFHSRNLIWDELSADLIEALELRRPRNGKGLMLPLQKKWELLRHLGVKEAERFVSLKLASELEGRAGNLTLRNNSVLVHGNRRSTPKNWKDVRYSVTSLLGAKEADLVTFALNQVGRSV